MHASSLYWYGYLSVSERIMRMLGLYILLIMAYRNIMW